MKTHVISVEDDIRDKSIICVVEGAKDIIAMEKSREYKGTISCTSWSYISYG